MTKPIVSWDDANAGAFPPELVWNAKLDNRYLIEVRRTGNYTATLHIFDHENGDKELAVFEVGLSYRALFGPDVSDVDDWEEMAANFVDKLNK